MVLSINNRRSIMLLKKLKIARKFNGYTQSDMAKRLNISIQGYRLYEQGKAKPKEDTLKQICSILNVSPSYLFNTEILEPYQNLNEENQKKAIEAVFNLLKIQKNKDVIKLQDNLVKYQVISEQSLSAGYGNGYTDEQETYTVYWDKDVRYDYAAEIEGNSMEPQYHNGDIALIRKTYTNDYDGCVCVIDDIANQRVYIKKIHIEDTYVRLESLNKETYDNGELIYPDILLENNDNLKLIGKVVDSFKPIEIK